MNEPEFEYSCPCNYARYSEIEAAILRLPVLPENMWEVKYLTDYLATIGNVIQKNGSDGRSPPHYQPASVEMIKNELKALAKRASELARKIEIGGGTQRAREQLALLVRNLHGPTMTALSDVDAVVLNGEPVLAEMEYFASGFPEKLERDAVSVRELRFWTKIAVLALNVRLKPRNVGRPHNYIADNVATTLALGYLNLTGRKPGTSKRTDNVGPFWGFLDEIFAILGIPVPGKNAGSQLSTTSRAARAAKSVRSTVRPKPGGKTQDVSIGAMDSDARSFFERYPEAMRIIVD